MASIDRIRKITTPIVPARLIIIAIIFSFLSCSSLEDKARKEPLSGIQKNKVAKLIHSIKKNYGRSFRTAVIDFSDSSGKKTPYGIHVADSAMRILSRYPSVQLLERSRIRSLLREHKLNRTGFIKADHIKKMGSFLPADVLATGSYSRINSEFILARARLIDIISGEILGTFSFRLRKIRFKKGNTKEVTEDAGDQCSRIQKPILESLKDLRDDKRVQHMIQRAVRVPFDMDCGRVHFKVIAHLDHINKYPANYIEFLGQTLGNIRQPGRDRRIAPILRYFGDDGIIDANEWRMFSKVLHNLSSAWSLRRMLYYLYRSPESKIPSQHINRIMHMAQRGKIGKPRVISPEKISIAIMARLRSFHMESASKEADFYQKYGRHTPRKAQLDKFIRGFLYTKYRKASASPVRDRFRNFLVSYYNDRELNKSRARKFWELIVDLDRESKSEQAKQIPPYRKARIRDARFFLARLPQYACAGLQGSISSINKDRNRLALRYGSKCGKLPDLKLLLVDLRSRNWRKKLAAVKTMETMGIHAAPAKKEILRYLHIKGGGVYRRLVRKSCARILALIKAKDSLTIRLLIAALPDYEGASREAMLTLAKIGKPAVPQLITTLAKGRRRRRPIPRYRVIETLGMIGPQARAARNILRKIAATARPVISRRAKASLYLIEKK